MDSAVDVFSAEVSKLSMQPGDNDRCIYVYDITSTLRPCNVLFFSLLLFCFVFWCFFF